jgi:hypothetical protein
MTAATYDITIEQGATFRLNLVWRDADNNPVDLTGYVARMQVRASYSDSAVQLNLTTQNGAIVLGGALGTIAVTGAATVTDDIPIRAGVYDLELEAADGTVTRLVQGKVRISPEVTR